MNKSKIRILLFQETYPIITMPYSWTVYISVDNLIQIYNVSINTKIL